MIIIDNNAVSTFTLPISNDGTEREFTFVHHLSGKSENIFAYSTSLDGNSFSDFTIPAGLFKYLGLYSFTVKDYLQNNLYIGLAKVTVDVVTPPVYINGIKDYELYK